MNKFIFKIFIIQLLCTTLAAQEWQKFIPQSSMMINSKDKNSDIFGTSTTNNNNSVSPRKNQIGIINQENIGNINSPTKDIDGTDNIASKETVLLLDEKNQLQQFIQETTGKQLDLYGYNLFKRTSFPSLMQIPAPLNYIVGPGDEIDIKVWGSIDFNIRQLVDRDGRITLPQIGSFGIAGTRVENLDDILKKQIGRIHKGFEVSGTLSKIRSIQIYVVGNAKKPGSYTVSGMSTFLSAIFDANGPSNIGSMRKIRLIREGKEISQIDLYDFIKNGEITGNHKLLPGDVIQIPSVGSRIALLGAIDGQAIYELKDSHDTLGDILGLVGETNTLVSTNKVVIERINSSETTANRSVDEISLNEEGKKFKLKDGDLVTLFKINHQYTNAVTIKGISDIGYRIKFSEGMRISKLIPAPEALIDPEYFTKRNLNFLKEEPLTTAPEKIKKHTINSLNQINWSYATIERLDKNEVKINLIPFNLERAIKYKDPTHDLELQSGDVVIVYNNKDIQIPQSKSNIFVKISGEVKAPGVYQIAQGESLMDLISQSGGITKDAYIYGTFFTRESIKKLQQENLTKALNRLESDINSQTISAAQNNLNPEMALASQQQLAGQKLFLNKLKNVQANGRISLEINPEFSRFPEVALENGDEIFIPSKPSFIGVFGSVYTESTFLYKQNATAKEYLSKAGLSREADINSIMIIRADSTIDSDLKSSGFFSKSVMDMTLYPGDTIFVPEVFDRRSSYTQFIQGAKDWTTILYQFGIGAAAWKTLNN